MAIHTSEIIKPFFLLAIASFLVRFPPTTFKTILLHIGFFLVPFFLIFAQPNLGNTIVYTAIWVAMVMLGGIPLFFMVLALIGNLLLFPIIYYFLRDYQKLRILTFLNPLLDPKGAGYNAIQAMIAVGSGKLFGRGFGRGTQTILQFLPEYHTDFIFAAYAEEFGFLGGLILLLLFYLLLWQIVKQARRIQENKFAFFYAGGFFMYIFTQIIVNIGMNLGLVPITGITLPLVSYGGSSLLSVWIGLGILVAAFNTRA
jgi:rod shape determining protein RodA